MDCKVCGGVNTAYFSYNYPLEATKNRGWEKQLPLFFVKCSECKSEYNSDEADSISKDVRDNFISEVDKYKEENHV